MSGGHIYILGSHTGTLYIGVTSNLYLRVEGHEDIRTAIAREKQLKGWRREKKLNLMRTVNPEFKDLAQSWGWKMIAVHEKM
jgi:putative endonuclease